VFKGKASFLLYGILTVSKKGFLGIFKWWKGDKNKKQKPLCFGKEVLEYNITF